VKVIKATSKGQITIPRRARQALGIDERTYLEVSVVEDEIRLRKVTRVRPLGEEDPIWQLAGSVESAVDDVSADHDRYLADGELARWRESS
jgi:AbrB family looped-hinge helix DNA binding protein